MFDSKFGKWRERDGNQVYLLVSPQGDTLATATFHEVADVWMVDSGTAIADSLNEVMKAVEQILMKRSIYMRLINGWHAPAVPPDAVAGLMIMAHVSIHVSIEDGRPLDWAAYAIAAHPNILPIPLADVLARGNKISEEAATLLFPALARACHRYRT